MYEKCFICNSPVAPFEWSGEDVQRVDCKLCHPYRISEGVVREIFPGGLQDGYLFSGVIRELNEKGRDVLVKNLIELRDSVRVPQGPLDQIDRILLYVSGKMRTADGTVTMSPDFDRAIAYARTASEFQFLTDQAEGMGYLEAPYGENPIYRLSLSGWKHIAELARYEVRTNQAFIAMSFDDSLRSVYLHGIKPALNETGYVPMRLDEAQYNEKIDDRIVADIRKSGLLIADFTQHKHGVYFEAGFALGLGIPVIWLCCHTDINNAHFDTRQYNYVEWKDAHDLKEKLVARIEATVPLKGSITRRADL